MKRFDKTPDAVLSYVFDWAAEASGRDDADGDWLASGETISSYTITAEDGITIDSDTNDENTVTITVSGGTAGNRYEIECNIVTSLGNEDTRTMIFHIKES